MSKFVLKKASNGQFHFRLQSGNNESILSSELYAAKGSALAGIESVKANAPLDDRYEKKQAANGQYMFNLKAANHQIIGTSEQYTTAASRDNGIAAVKRAAPTAITDDQSA